VEKNKYSNSRVVGKKISERNKKNITPLPPPGKLNGRSLAFAIFTTAKKQETFITSNLAKKRASPSLIHMTLYNFIAENVWNSVY
jgi:hypothetical protein